MKLHTPTFHRHGSKYKIGSWGRVTIGDNSRVKWRAGWRQHGSGSGSGSGSDSSFKTRTLANLTGSSTSALGFYGRKSSGLLERL